MEKAKVLAGLTESEKFLIYDMFVEGYATDDYDDPFMTWGVYGRSERGVLSSLVKKGVLFVQNDDDERPVFLEEPYTKVELAEAVGYKLSRV